MFLKSMKVKQATRPASTAVYNEILMDSSKDGRYKTRDPPPWSTTHAYMYIVRNDDSDYKLMREMICTHHTGHVSHDGHGFQHAHYVKSLLFSRLRFRCCGHGQTQKNKNKDESKQNQEKAAV
jgi:hypothetical protein